MPPTRRAQSLARNHQRHRNRNSTKKNEKDKSENSAASILSSVFTFVSREFDSFVSSATGKEPHVVEDDEDDEDVSHDEEDEGESTPRPRPSSSRSTRSQGQRHTRRKSCASQKSLDGKRNRAPPKGKPLDSHIDSEHGSSDSEVNTSGRYRNGDAKELRKAIEDLDVPYDSNASVADSPPRTRTTRSVLKKRSFTMPGSLFDRTSSLEPTPEPESRRGLSVRFVTDESSEADESFETPRTDVEEPMAGPSKPRSPLRAPDFNHGRTSNDFSGSESEFDDATPSKQIAAPKPAARAPFRSLPITPVKPRKVQSEQVVLTTETPRRNAKEKERSAEGMSVSEGRATNPSIGNQRERTHSGSGSDISYDFNVLGKEKELNAARQEQAERGDNSCFDEEERARDKERIRLLEEELKKLREELARRPPSAHINFLAPPPPPPPPPPPLNFSLPKTRNLDTSFADVRAALRHTETPNEKPINPAYDGAAKRKGQPTIVGADMMSAFLSEMKTHRLRKVGSAQDMLAPQASQPAVRVRDVGADVGNRTEVMIRPRENQEAGNRTEIVPRTTAFATPALSPARPAPSAARQQSADSGSDIQASRKRKLTGEAESASSAAVKRRAITPAETPSILGGLSNVRGPATVQRLKAKEPDRPALPAFPGTHLLPDSGLNFRNNSITSNSTGIATPSLSSDNSSRDDHDRSPPTPPLASTSFSLNTSVKQKSNAAIEQPSRIPESSRIGRRQHPIPVEDDEVVEIDGFEEIPTPNKSEAKGKERDSSMVNETFFRREMTSAKLVDSPRRPRPPSRNSRSGRETPSKRHVDMVEDADISLANRTIQPAPSNKEQDAEVLPESSFRNGPIRPPPGTFKAPPPPSASLRPRRFSTSNRSFDRSLNTSGNANRTDTNNDSDDDEALAEETFVIPKARAKAKAQRSTTKLVASTNGDLDEVDLGAEETFVIPTMAKAKKPPVQHPKSSAPAMTATADETFALPTTRTRRRPRDSLELELRRAEPSLLLDINLDDEMESGRVNGGLGMLESDADADGEELDEGADEGQGDRTFLVPIQEPQEYPVSRSRSHSANSTSTTSSRRKSTPRASSKSSANTSLSKSAKSKASEMHVFEGNGTGTRRGRGFLAHGGGGGKPVMMDESYSRVQGAFESSDVEEDNERDGDWEPEQMRRRRRTSRSVVY